jgi:hypothetical protein
MSTPLTIDSPLSDPNRLVFHGAFYLKVAAAWRTAVVELMRGFIGGGGDM